MVMTVPSTTLDELGRAYGTGKIVHGYLPILERWLEPFRYESFDFLEIGVHQGASIRMWHDYFPNARVVGLDIRNAAPDLTLPRYTFVQGNQGDQALLERLSREYRFRVVVDDGSHRWTHQINTFKTFFPAMSPHGIFFCEGLMTSFGALAPRYGGENEPTGADFFLRLARIVLAGSSWDQEKEFYGDAALRELAAWVSELRILRHGVIIERSSAIQPKAVAAVLKRPQLVAAGASVKEDTPKVETTPAEVSVCQLLMTRFNIRSTGAGYSEDQDPNWLDERLALFERYCLPSIADQTQKQFTWVVFCDEHTRDEILDRIRAYDPRIRIARFVTKVGVPAEQAPQPVSYGYLSPGEEPVLHNLSPLPFVPPGAQVLVSTRIDNDDAIRADALERARAFVSRFLETGHDRMVYNPLLGYKLDTVNSRLYATQMHNTPFLSLFERLSEATWPKGALSGNHGHMHEQFPTHQADGRRLWVQVLHGGNVSNHVKSTDVELPLEELGTEFGFSP
jgi:hypothetical protein